MIARGPLMIDTSRPRQTKHLGHQQHGCAMARWHPTSCPGRHLAGIRQCHASSPSQNASVRSHSRQMLPLFPASSLQVSCPESLSIGRNFERSISGIVSMTEHDHSADPLVLSPEAAASLKRLPFKDCNLVLKDTRLLCHRLKLAEVSDVLGSVTCPISAPPHLACMLRSLRGVCGGWPFLIRWVTTFKHFGCVGVPKCIALGHICTHAGTDDPGHVQEHAAGAVPCTRSAATG